MADDFEYLVEKPNFLQPPSADDIEDFPIDPGVSARNLTNEPVFSEQVKPSTVRQHTQPYDFPEGYENRKPDWGLVDFTDNKGDTYWKAIPFHKIDEQGSPNEDWRIQMEQYDQLHVDPNDPDASFNPLSQAPTFRNFDNAKSFTTQANAFLQNAPYRENVADLPEDQKAYYNPYTMGYLPRHLSKDYYDKAHQLTEENPGHSVNYDWDSYMHSIKPETVEGKSPIPGWMTYGDKLHMRYRKGRNHEWFNPQVGKEYPGLGVYHGMRPSTGGLQKHGLPVFEREGSLFQHEGPSGGRPYSDAPPPSPPKAPPGAITGPWPGRIFDRR